MTPRRVLLAGLVALAAPAAALPSESDEAAALAQLTSLAEERGKTPELVRFAFHSTFFGAHGCLDLDNADNAGLASIKEDVDDLYDARDDHFGGMSRADFWALAGIAGVRVGAAAGGASAPVPPLVMRYGREDLPDSCVGATGFPNALGGMAESMATLGAKYNLTAREVTVLMGAHALGSADAANSGFVGPWSPPTDTLDNGFYREMADTGNRDNNWAQQTAPNNAAGAPDRKQWSTNGRIQDNGARMMLNTDMALLYQLDDVDADGDGSTATCPTDPSGCGRASWEGVSTADIVDEMAGDNAKFMEEFGAVFQKMIEVNVTDSLRAVGEEEDGDDDAGEGDADEGDADEGDAGEGDAGEGDADEGDADEGDADEGDADEGDADEGASDADDDDADDGATDDEDATADEDDTAADNDDTTDEDATDDENASDDAGTDDGNDSNAADSRAPAAAASFFLAVLSAALAL